MPTLIILRALICKLCYIPFLQLLWVPDSKSSQRQTLTICLWKKDTQHKNHVWRWEKMRSKKSLMVNNFERSINLCVRHSFPRAAAAFIHWYRSLSTMEKSQWNYFVLNMTVWTTQPNHERHLECCPKPLSVSWQEMSWCVSWVKQNPWRARLNRQCVTQTKTKMCCPSLTNTFHFCNECGNYAGTQTHAIFTLGL